jgi:hypothetical protein
MQSEKITKPVQYFTFGVVFLTSLYILLMVITTGSTSDAIYQFNFYLPWILGLSLGFGIQLALYKLIKLNLSNNIGADRVAKTTTATSTVTMIACCVHHAADILPIIGVSAFAALLGAYTKELFAVGIIFNIFGISYMLKQLITLRKRIQKKLL